VSRQVGSGAEERQEMGLSRQGQGTPEAQVMGGDGSLDSVSRQVGSGAVESQEKGVSRRSQGHGGFGVSTLESELIKSLTIQTEEDRKRLEAANYRIGYLEAQLETYISPYEHNQEREFLLLQSQKLISECEKKETQIALLMSHKYKIRKTIILTILGLVLVFGLVRLIGGSGFF
jgi:hypothetical protein